LDRLEILFLPGAPGVPTPEYAEALVVADVLGLLPDRF
jgi:hypothetical protein